MSAMNANKKPETIVRKHDNFRTSVMPRWTAIGMGNAVDKLTPHEQNEN